MNQLLSRLGGFPRRILWDNEAGIVSHHRLIPQASAWAGTMGASIKLAKPRDPETKGRIERANGFLDRSFEPARQFTTITDFNTQLTDWLDEIGNKRTVRVLNARPCDLVGQEQTMLTPLPDLLPEAQIEKTIRLTRDYHIRIAESDYSISPRVIGRIITIKASLDRVTAWCDGEQVADHHRSLKPHQTITDPTHVDQAAILRHHYQHTTTSSRQPIRVVESRDLASYDQLWKKAA